MFSLELDRELWPDEGALRPRRAEFDLEPRRDRELDRDREDDLDCFRRVSAKLKRTGNRPSR